MAIGIDLAFVLGLLCVVLAIAVGYTARVALAGGLKDERLDKHGTSPLLGGTLMRATYWALRAPLRLCLAMGWSANAVTWASLVLAAIAGGALALGHYGVGAAFAIGQKLLDCIDGMIARETGTSSDAGEVLDASADRYAEFFFLAGIAFHERADATMLVLALAATLGSIMVSYSSAKAEALHVKPPRGWMRHGERAAYLLTGTALVPFVALASARWGWPAWAEHAPVYASLGVVGIVGNVSAVRRLAAVADAVRKPAPRPERESDEEIAQEPQHAAVGDVVR